MKKELTTLVVWMNSDFCHLVPINYDEIESQGGEDTVVKNFLIERFKCEHYKKNGSLIKPEWLATKVMEHVQEFPEENFYAIDLCLSSHQRFWDNWGIIRVKGYDHIVEKILK